jgi:SAM-dependent methyltransferase
VTAVVWLPDAPGTVRDLPVFGSVHPMRDVTRQVAFEGRWEADTRVRVAELFDSMAARWTADHDRPDKRAAIGDALERGGVAPGRTIELGSGSGIGTEELAARGHEVVALDLSLAMLREAPAEHGARVQGDSSALPFPSDAVDTVACVNMLLFPAEVDRILTDDGALVWVNTLAEETPIHLAPEDVVAALPGPWRAVAGRAGTGLWCVARRA